MVDGRRSADVVVLALALAAVDGRRSADVVVLALALAAVDGRRSADGGRRTSSFRRHPFHHRSCWEFVFVGKRLRGMLLSGSLLTARSISYKLAIFS